MEIGSLPRTSPPSSTVRKYTPCEPGAAFQHLDQQLSHLRKRQYSFWQLRPCSIQHSPRYDAPRTR